MHSIFIYTLLLFRSSHFIFFLCLCIFKRNDAKCLHHMNSLRQNETSHIVYQMKIDAHAAVNERECVIVEMRDNEQQRKSQG